MTNGDRFGSAVKPDSLRPVDLDSPGANVAPLASVERVSAKVRYYLEASEHRYTPSQHEYWGRKALQQAHIAFVQGDYGIGAVALLVKDGVVYEFPNHNAMFSGLGVQDHAEARALTDCVRFRASLEQRPLLQKELSRTSLVPPAETYKTTDLKSANDESFQDGIYIYSTLEPCPMCTVMILNSQAKSVCNAIDGQIENLSGQKMLTGGGMCLGDKLSNYPSVWQEIATGQKQVFSLLETDDFELVRLSSDIFHETREYIDQTLLGRAVS